MTETIENFHRYLAEEEPGIPALKTHKIVCPQCRGTGASSAYLGAFTHDELMEDIEFCEQYLSGGYDRTCETCHGKNVIDDVDEEATDKETLNLWHSWLQDEAEYRAEVEAERRMGA